MSNSIVKNETQGEILGVPGRFFNVVQSADGRVLNQKFLSHGRPIAGYGSKAELSVEIRFDDECKNGHASFAITGEVRRPGRRDIEACGCLHDDIAAVFPELAPLIKWHLTSTDGPMHYIANTVYMAGDRDSSGRRAGEAVSFDYGVRFGDSPITVLLKKSFYDWLNAAEQFNSTALKSNPAYVRFEPVAVEHTKEQSGYAFKPKYTLKGFDCKWHECPFDNIREAEEFSAAMLLSHAFVKVPTGFSKGKARELDAARRVAVWPEATNEELSQDKATLTAALEARLPGLLAAFKADVLSCGFVWSV